jgi:NAD+ diphosphatase
MPFRSLIGTQPEGLWCGAARALSILNWRSSTRFCGKCGTANGDKPGELARLCPACGTLSFPRISPALLAVVMKGDKLLLARNTQYKTGIWSVLAGFLEPGETLEDCLRREVREEVDIEVEPGAYLGSQPWPYPDQLMVALGAEWKSGQLRPDGVEIAEADWFGPEDLPPLPLPGSLSRRVIDMAFAAMGGGGFRGASAPRP